MKPRVYIETTIPSYLTARPSRDLIRAAHQQLTREWWDQRAEFDLYVSRLVLLECGAGDPDAAAERMASLAGLPVLSEVEPIIALADALLDGVPLPAKASADAVQIATSAVHRMDYLLTWNCRHIANATLRSRVEAICRAAGFEPPLICTPDELRVLGDRP
jgi:hypothetical protein